MTDADEGPEVVFLRALDAFVEGLKAQDPALEGLRGPAEAAQIAAAERALQVTLPSSYKAFLLKHNGAAAHDTSIYGVGIGEDDEEALDLTVMNLKAREDELPAQFLAFAATLSGDSYCFDVSSLDEDGECPVLLLDQDEGHLVAVCGTFGEWLERLPGLEAELQGTRGPQPMTVEEWEQFLVRERAKLRKLSRTPAREIAMPDPERVRADLAGKIPVDPRHLKPKE